MSATAPPVTPAPVPEPVAAAETKVEAAAPDAVRPEVEVVDKAFNEFAGNAVAEGAAAGPELEARDPALSTAITDVEKGNVLGAVGQFGTIKKEVKAGYKTTEFWLTVAGVVATQLGAIHVPGKYGTTIQDTALIAAYALSRGLAK